jgi:hypothetical protein
MTKYNKILIWFLGLFHIFAFSINFSWWKFFENWEEWFTNSVYYLESYIVDIDFMVC